MLTRNPEVPAPEVEKKAKASRKKEAKANRKAPAEDTALNLSCRGTAYRVWDSGALSARGLSVHRQPTGTKTYRAHYRQPNGKPAAIKLGRVGEMTLEEARNLTRDIRAQAAKARRPEVTLPHEARAVPMFKPLIVKWIELEQVGANQNLSAEKTRGGRAQCVRRVA